VVIPYYRIAFETLEIFCQITKPFSKVNLNSFVRVLFLFFRFSIFIGNPSAKYRGCSGRQALYNSRRYVNWHPIQ